MDNNQTINFDRPIKAVALDPQFFRSGSGKHFVTGDDKVEYRHVIYWLLNLLIYLLLFN